MAEKIATLAIDAELSRLAFVAASKRECEGGKVDSDIEEYEYVVTCLALISRGKRERDSTICDRCCDYAAARIDLQKKRRRLQRACSRAIQKEVKS